MSFSVILQPDAREFRNLVLGQTFNVQTFEKGISPFDKVLKVERNDDHFVCECKVVKDSINVIKRDAFSGGAEIALKRSMAKIGAHVGGGYEKKKNEEQKVTEVQVRIKCTTITEVIDCENIKVRKKIKSFNQNAIGTHFVNAVTYGVELSATLKLKTSSVIESYKREGGLDASLGALGELHACVKKLIHGCEDSSDIEINYEETQQPGMMPTDPEQFMKLITSFPERLSGTRGNPIQLELQTLGTIGITHGIKYRTNRTLTPLMEEFGDKYRDLRSCYEELKTYQEGLDKEAPQDVQTFYESVQTAMRKFHEAIDMLGFDGDEVPFLESLESYKRAINGRAMLGKFMAEWRKLLKRHNIVTKSKLPKGSPYTVCIIGKTGDGKSAIGNQLLGGEGRFKENDSATSSSGRCEMKERKNDRTIRVIDTHGTMDTATANKGSRQRSNQEIMSHWDELEKAFEEAGNIDAFVLTLKYGARFDSHESEAFRITRRVLGEVINYIIVVLTHGDDAERTAKREGKPVKEVMDRWLNSLPKDVRDFVSHDIKKRVVLFNNTLEAGSEGQVTQITQLLKTIDAMADGNTVQKLTVCGEEKIKSILEELDSRISTLKRIEKNFSGKSEDEKLIMNLLKSLNKKRRKLKGLLLTKRCHLPESLYYSLYIYIYVDYCIKRLQNPSQAAVV